MSRQNTQYAYINAFNLIPGIGPKKLYILAGHFDTFEHAWKANTNNLMNAGISEKLAQTILKFRKKINPLDEFYKLQNFNIKLITIQDEHFPKKLKTISSPPFLLYVRGDVNLLNTPSVAVVGSRKISDYGKHAITSIIHDIAHSSITIVSGLALGTDALAHREALEANGPIIAVLGGGIDDATLTPRSHTNLAKQILDTGGTLISEYPVGTQPNRGTFPARNRIMAGLTDATIIIEADKKSGTLITAEHAHKFERKLFALPGSIFSQNSLGPNMLIRDKKAQPLLCADDILSIFDKKNLQTNTGRTCPSTTLTKTQKVLHRTIKKHPDGVQLNTIIKKVDLDNSTISSELTIMEIDGIVKNIGNQTYVLIRDLQK